MNTTARFRASAILVLGVAAACAATAQDSGQPEPRDESAFAEPDLHAQLLGAWRLAGKPGTTEQPGPGARMRFFARGHWTITQADPETGAVLHHHGGTYTLDGDTLVEKILFANPSTASLIGKEFRFKVSVDGETYTQIGDGNPWSEAWRRAAG